MTPTELIEVINKLKAEVDKLIQLRQLAKRNGALAKQGLSNAEHWINKRKTE